MRGVRGAGGAAVVALDPSLPNAIAAYNFTRTEFKANGTDILDSYGHRGFDGVLLSSDLPQFVWSTDDYVTLTQIPPPPPSPPPFYYEKERGPSSLYFDGVDVSALIREQDNDPLEFNFSSTDSLPRVQHQLLCTVVADLRRNAYPRKGFSTVLAAPNQ